VSNQELARVAELRAAVTRAEAGAVEAESREARLSERLDGLPLWRRSERAEVRSSVIRARRNRERHVAESRAAKAELTRLAPAVERSRGVDRARTAAGEMGVELTSIEGRLDAWTGRDQAARARPSLDRARGRAGVESDLGRDR
jgi:hypothetical protein